MLGGVVAVGRSITWSSYWLSCKIPYECMRCERTPYVYLSYLPLLALGQPSAIMPPKSRAKASRTLKSSGLTADTADVASVANGSLVPNWPLLQPLIPTEDLYMQILLQDQIILIRQLFTPSLCRNYVSFLSSLPLITTPATPKEGNAVRINDRFEVHDAGFAQRLWSLTGLAHVLSGSVGAKERTPSRPDELMNRWGGELRGLNPRIRVYRYRKGHRFGPHCRFTRMIHQIGWGIFVLI